MDNRTRWIIAVGAVGFAVVVGIVAAQLGSSPRSESAASSTTILPVATTEASERAPTSTTAAEEDSESVDPPLPVAGPLNADLTLADVTVERTIGYDGGSLEATGPDGTGYVFEIPEGAVVADVTVTLTPIVSVSGTPFDDTFVGGVLFGPEGYAFIRPATLTITPPNGVAEDVFAFGGVGEGEDLAVEPLTVAGDAVKISVFHFSVMGAASGPDEERQLAAHRPSDALRQAYAEVGAEFQACMSPTPSVSCEEAAQSAFQEIWDQFIQPEINSAMADPHRVVNAPAGEFPTPLRSGNVPQWARVVSWITEWGTKSDNQVDFDIRPILEAALNTSYQVCSGRLIPNMEDTPENHVKSLFDAPRAYHVTLQAALIEAGGLGVQIGDLSSLNAGCASIVIQRKGLTEYLDAGQEGQLRVRVGVRFEGTGGITRWDLGYPDTSGSAATKIAVSASAELGTVSGPVSLASDVGTYEATVKPDGQEGMEATVRAQHGLGVLGSTSGSRTFAVKPSSELTLTGKKASGGGFVDSLTVDLGETVTVRAKVVINEEPASNREVHFTLLSGPGHLNPVNGLTDSDGNVEVTFTPAEGAGVATIKAETTVDSGLVFSDTITVSVGKAVTITPDTAIVTPGVSVEFSVTTVNLDPGTVTWQTPDGGFFSEQTGTTATWVAPSTPGDYTIKATSTADTGVFGTAVVTVIESEEPVGEFSEGYFFGRPMHECEWNPDYDLSGHTCESEIAEITVHPPVNSGQRYRAWIHVYDDAGEMQMDLYYSRWDACGWKSWDLSYQTCTLDAGDEWRWRAHWIWQERTISEVGPVSTVAEVPRFNHPNHVLCYIECLSPPNINLGTFRYQGMRLEFYVDKVILISRPDAELWQQTRWVFTQHTGGSSFDPFGTWAFHPDSLETPEAFQAYNP